VRSPTVGVLQAVLLLVIWVHGCLGIQFWLRLKPFYPLVRDPTQFVLTEQGRAVLTALLRSPGINQRTQGPEK
jgi:hypothetical protein